MSTRFFRAALVLRPRLAAFVIALGAFGAPLIHAGAISGTALVRHGPSLNGTVDGSIQQMLPESVTLNGGAIVTGDLLVPGFPTVRLNGKPTFLGTLDLAGAATPSNHQITLNGGASLAHVVRRVDPVPLTTVTAPALPTGSRFVTINVPGQAVGPWSTLRHLTLNGGVGDVAVPPGTYGDFTANGGTSFTLGVAGAVQPSAYNFQRINLNGQAQIRVIGPVVLTVAYGFSGNGTIGATAHPEWLTLNVYSGGFTLNGGCQVYGFVNAPVGTVIVNGNSQLVGGVSCDRLTVNGGGLLRLTSPISENLPPVAQPDSFSLDEDASVVATLAGSDPEGAPITFVIASRPAHGSLHTSLGPITVYPTAPLSESAIRYVPVPDYAGSDSFTFYVSDGQMESPPATVSLLVRPVNDAPVASADPVTLAEDAPEGAIVTLRAVDKDSPVITFSIVTGPQSGQLLPGAGDAFRVYRPDPDFFGTDSFTFLAHDGSLNSEPVTVAITVTPVNDSPIAFSQSLVTREENGLDVVLTGFDVDGDALVFTRVNEPFGGLLSGVGAGLRYEPLTNFADLDWFEFTVSDGQSVSAPARISIEVTNENDAPRAESFAVTTAEDASVGIALSGEDDDGDPIWFSIVRQPEHAQGELVVSGSTVTYRPVGDYFGPDSFTYKATDIFGADSSEATIAITVEPINDAPVAHGQTLSTDEDRPADVTLTGADTEDSSVSFEIVQHPAMGELTDGGGPGIYRFIPFANENGADQFTFVVRDSEGLASEATVVPIAIQPVNDAPAALPQALEIAEDGELPFEFTSIDDEGDPVSYEIATPPQFGTVGPEGATDATRVYTPATDYHGPDSLTFIARDADASEPATISIIVLPVNDAPEASAPEVVTDRNVAVSLTLVARDIDGDPLVFDLLTGPGHGTLESPGGPLSTFPRTDLPTPNLTYTPAYDFAGEDSLTFQARDSEGAASAIITVPILVRATNRPPVAKSSDLDALEDEPLALVLEASDPDGDALSYVITSQPLHGTLLGEGVHRNYQANTGFSGLDRFSFKVNDGTVDSPTATVAIVVVVRAKQPTADSKTIETDKDTSVQITLSGSDPEGATLAYNIVAPPEHGVLSGYGANLIYTPFADYTGTDILTYTVRARGVDSQPASVSITVRVEVTPLSPPTVVFGTATSVPTVGAGVMIDLSRSSGLDRFIRFEFYDGESLLGESSSGVSFLAWIPSRPGTHHVWVRGFAADGRYIDSQFVDISVVASLPYTTGFDVAEGYQLGSINEQLGWTSTVGVRIEAGGVENECLALGESSGVFWPEAAQPILSSSNEAIAFVDFSAKAVAGSTGEMGCLFDGQAARLALILDGSGLATLYSAFNNGLEYEWVNLGLSYPVDSNGCMLGWIRLTIRKDFTRKEWDLFVDGRLQRIGLPFVDEKLDQIGRLIFLGPNEGISRVDNVYCGLENPMFVDLDGNGIEDAWESSHGLPRGASRYADDDYDGLTTVREYMAGSDPFDSDSDGDGLSDSEEMEVGTNPREVDSDGDQLDDRWEFAYGLDPKVPALAQELAADGDHDGLSLIQESRAGTDPRQFSTVGDEISDGWKIAHNLDPLDGSLFALDADWDGLSTLHEYRQGTDPGDYYNSLVPQIEILSDGDGANEPGRLAIRVLSPSGIPLAWAPLEIQAPAPNIKFATTPLSGILSATLQVRTDMNGVAAVYAREVSNE